MARSMAARTVGWLTWPATPMLADRSPGPMKTPSTPSTFAMSSRCSSASTVSTCTSTQISPEASATYLVSRPKRVARTVPPMPRMPFGG